MMRCDAQTKKVCQHGQTAKRYDETDEHPTTARPQAHRRWNATEIPTLSTDVKKDAES
jgi:hypothetical protein